MGNEPAELSWTEAQRNTLKSRLTVGDPKTKCEVTRRKMFSAAAVVALLTAIRDTDGACLTAFGGNAAKGAAHARVHIGTRAEPKPITDIGGADALRDLLCDVREAAGVKEAKRADYVAEGATGLVTSQASNRGKHHPFFRNALAHGLRLPEHRLFRDSQMCDPAGADGAQDPAAHTGAAATAAGGAAVSASQGSDWAAFLT